MKLKRIISILCAFAVLITSIIAGKPLAEFFGMDFSAKAEGSKYVYDFETDYQTNSANISGSDGSYINYNPTHSSFELAKEGNNTYFKHVRTQGGSTSFIRTTYELENDSYYRVSLKYKLDGTKNKNNFNHKPRFIAATNLNGWNGYGVNNDYTKICDITGSTLTDSGARYNNGELNLRADAAEWLTHTEIIYTSNIIGAKNKNQKYFGFYFMSNDSTYTSFCVDDLTIEKINITDFSPKTKTFDFTEIEGVFRNHEDMFSVDTANGYLKLDKDKTYCHSGLAFEYILKPETGYKVEVRYRITKNGGIKNFGLYGVARNFLVSSMANKYATLASATSSDFAVKEYKFSTGTATDVAQWLALHIEPETGSVLEIDWLKISEDITIKYEPSDGCDFESEYDISETGATNSQYVSQDGYMHYRHDEIKATIEEEESNHYLKIQRIKNTPVVALKTRIELKKNTYYKVTFDYKLPVNSFNKYPIFTASLGTDVWHHWCYKQNDSRPCKLSGDTLTSDKMTYAYDATTWSNDRMMVTQNEEWTSYSEVIYTDGIVGGGDKDQKYLGIFFMAGYSFTNMCIDNITVVEMTDDILSSDTKLYDFNDPNEDYLYRNTYHNTSVTGIAEIDRENGYLHVRPEITYSYCAFHFDYKLEPETTYKVKYRYNMPKCNIWGGKDSFGLYETENFFNIGNPETVDCTEDTLLYYFTKHTTKGFVEKEIEFTTKASDGRDKFLTFLLETTDGVELDFDWILITKVDESGVDDPDKEYILNGGFESGRTAWTELDSVTDITDDKFEGKSALHITGGYFDDVYQAFIPKSGFNYELSFRYKGTSSGITNWAVTHDAVDTSNDYAIQKGTLEATEEWKEISVVFSPENYSIFYVMFRTDGGCDFIVDNVSVKRTNKTATPALEQSEGPKLKAEPYVTHQLYDSGTTQSIYYVCADEDNLITDASFEEGTGNWNQKNLYSNGTMSLVSDANSREGNKALKFSAYGMKHDDSWGSFYFDVEPNTEYYLTAIVKGEQWSDKDKCDMNLGFVDIETGRFITNTDGRAQTATKQVNFCYDNEWHIVKIGVNSGNATKLGIGFVGGNATAYIDRIWVFKDADKVLYKFAKKDMEKIVITNEAPALTGANAEDNVLENTDFADSDLSFWTEDATSIGYEITAEVDDSGSSKGKGLYYIENTYGTGMPKQTYYIKWVPVEKNTEYTFAADLSITKEGKGWFGIIDGNEFLPNKVKTFTFNEGNMGKWHEVAVSFNTKEYERIGIAVCDIGGEAYMDNMRLVNSANAVVHVPPESFYDKIETSKYDIKDGYIVLEESGVKAVTMLNSMKHNEYIKAYDKDGKKITNTAATSVTTGSSFKMYDGKAFVDGVTIIVMGDVNKDGLRNTADLNEILMYLSKEKELDIEAFKAADLDKNGKIDINDAVLMCAYKDK